MESQDKDDLPSFPVVGALNRRRPQRRLPNPLNHAFRAVPPENRPVPQKVYRRPVMRRQEPAERSRHICGTSLESSMLHGHLPPPLVVRVFVLKRDTNGLNTRQRERSRESLEADNPYSIQPFPTFASLLAQPR